MTRYSYFVSYEHARGVGNMTHNNEEPWSAGTTKIVQSRIEKATGVGAVIVLNFILLEVTEELNND